MQTGAGARIDDFYRIDAKDFALVFAQARDGGVIMLRQWRQGLRRFAPCFPGGHVETGEDRAKAAHRELREETGWAADRAVSLGRFSMHSDFHLGWGHFCLVRDARLSGHRINADLETPQVIKVDIRDLESSPCDGRIATVHDAFCARLGMMDAWPDQPEAAPAGYGSPSD